MRIILQRVISASVTVEGSIAGEIGAGLLILVGVAGGDVEAEASRMAHKCAELRVFSDADGKFNRSLLDTGGEALVVSQFTLFADIRRGRRPSFTSAASPDVAEPLMDAFAETLRSLGVTTKSGVFGAHMRVELVNDGPVTIILDSDDLNQPRRGS